MKFPGQRKSKHYFPVHARDPLVSQAQSSKRMSRTHIIGIDQTLVDIEAKVSSELIEKYGEDFEVPRLSKMAKCTECGSPHGCGVDLGLLESPDGNYPDFKHGG